MLTWKWRLAYKLDKYPKYCWPGLYDWANGEGSFSVSESGAQCVKTAQEKGSCYCGKFVTERSELHPQSYVVPRLPSDWSPNA